MKSEKLNLIFFVSYFNFYVRFIRATFVKKNYLKLARIYNHFVIVNPINCCIKLWPKIESNSSSVLAKLAKMLSSSKLWTEDFWIKKRKSFKKFCIKLVWKLSLGMHLTELCQTRFIHYFFEHFVYGILNKNRFSKVNHYLGHMLRDLRSISRLVYSQKVSLPFLKHSYQHKLNTVWLSIYC